ncbi:MAG: DUF4160 domain-containing protein, partial [Chloroflexota bacterium]|nr:DUF4160 domain-containing protein [Chloroflexota bacterium]
YYKDHPPSHFHARYGEYEAKFLVSDGTLLNGVFPKISRRRVTEWARRHREELALNWQRAEQRHRPTVSVMNRSSMWIQGMPLKNLRLPELGDHNASSWQQLMSTCRSLCC